MSGVFDVPASPEVSVVIVNFRTKELTLAAAFSALAEPEVGEVLVVDNGSDDGSAAYLRRHLPEVTCRVLESPTNEGFGRAVNRAAREARAPMLLVLNSDATLMPGAVGRLVQALAGDGTAAVVAPAVYEADGRTLQAGAFGSFPRLKDRPWTRRGRTGVGDTAGSDDASSDDAGSLQPDWVSGVAMLVRGHDFLAVGGFDPDFEMYLEDVDLCRRLRAEGRTVRRQPAAGVVHLGGRSWPSSAVQRARYQSSKVTYFRKTGASPTQLAYVRALKAVRVLAARCSPRRFVRSS